MFLLFVIEATVDNMKIKDVNWSPSLSQLFFRKVVFHVGGAWEMDFETFVSDNPDWLKIVRPFLFEALLFDLKLGAKMKLPELKNTMNKVSHFMYTFDNDFV